MRDLKIGHLCTFFVFWLLSLTGQSAIAGLFDGGKITGHNLGYCLPMNAGGNKSDGKSASLGFGLGYTHYIENSSFWYGTREQWDLCAGRFIGLQVNSTTSRPEGEEFSAYGGSFVEFAYQPIGGTLLPGLYFTPGLFWIPSFYANIGLTGKLQVVQKTLYIVEHGEWTEREDDAQKYVLQGGPEVTLGMQGRFYLVDIFAAGRYNMLLGIPGEFTGAGITLLAGLGVSFVN